jgi:hypothetical protein
MNGDFEKKVRSAAVAGWWTVLVGALALSIQWLAYLFVMSSRPALVLSLWGSADWLEVQRLWLLGTVAFKFLLAFLALFCLWLTLWARQLRLEGRA